MFQVGNRVQSMCMLSVYLGKMTGVYEGVPVGLASVFPGDVGTVEKVNENGTFTVAFDPRPIIINGEPEKPRIVNDAGMSEIKLV